MDKNAFMRVQKYNREVPTPKPSKITEERKTGFTLPVSRVSNDGKALASLGACLTVADTDLVVSSPSPDPLNESLLMFNKICK